MHNIVHDDAELVRLRAESAKLHRLRVEAVSAQDAARAAYAAAVTAHDAECRQAFLDGRQPPPPPELVLEPVASEFYEAEDRRLQEAQRSVMLARAGGFEAKLAEREAEILAEVHDLAARLAPLVAEAADIVASVASLRMAAAAERRDFGFAGPTRPRVYPGRIDREVVVGAALAGRSLLDVGEDAMAGR